MIPILYAGTEQSFLNNGLGRLSDAVTCKVTEERNGIFELEMTYPITGIHYKDISLNNVILAKTEEGGSNQAFIIYSITRPINGIVTVKANHISYLLNGFVVMPFSAVSLADAMSKINPNSVIETPFTFLTDISSDINFSFDTPRSIRSLLGGEQGSLLDTYGGYDYRFDNFQVSLLADRGNDNGVVLRYGKNLTELKNLDNTTNIYTGIVPYWKNDATEVYLPEKVVLSEHATDYPYKIIKTVDFSQEFETEPTQAQLRAKAESYLANNRGWALKNSIDVSFVALWQSDEYKDIAALERVRMCDTVRVVYSKLGVDIKTRVIKTVYNVLLERYDSISLGDSTYNLTQAIQETIMDPEIQRNRSFTKDAVARATKLIQGGLGGHVVFNTNGNGEPQEILIMDTDDIQTAVNVIRMNLNGIGFSRNGYAGPFRTAWTVDGHFVADFIDTGNLNAGLLKVGTITDDLGNNYWNLETGAFSLSPTTQVGNSTIASADDVSGALSDAEDYADGVASNAETAAKDYADGAISSYDSGLGQQAVFNKLTNNGTAQGIFLENGDLYINGAYIQAQSIAANALSVAAKEDLATKHNYISDEIYERINIWEYNLIIPPYYETIDNIKYIVMDGTSLSEFNVNYYIQTAADAMGDANIEIHVKLHFDTQVVLAANQRFLFVRYYSSVYQSGRITWFNIEAGTYQADTDYVFNHTFKINNIDYSKQIPKVGIYYIQGTKTYLEEFTASTYIDNYTSASMKFNADGLSMALESGEHDYLPYDKMTNIDRWENEGSDHGMVMSLATMTFDGESHQCLVIDATNVPYNWEDAAEAWVNTDLIGKPSVTIKYKFRVSANYTITKNWHELSHIRFFRPNGNRAIKSFDRHEHDESFSPGTEYSFEDTYTFASDEIDYFKGIPRFGLNGCSGVIMYIYDIELIGTNDDYKKSSLIYTVDGLASTVQAGSIISTINQSAEAVEIEASKINLTGDLSLRGQFQAFDTSDDTNYIDMTSGAIKVFNQGDNVFTVASIPLIGQRAGIFFGDPEDSAELVKHTHIDSSQGTFPWLYVRDTGDYEYRLGQIIHPNEVVTAVFEGAIEFWGDTHVCNSGNTDLFTVSGNSRFYGNVYNSSGTTVFVSDKRKKRSIKDLVIEKAKSFIMALRPREFKFKKEISAADRKHHGFIAQEVHEAMWEDWGLYCEDKDNDFIGLRYDELLADMVAVIQDQEKRIDALERRLNDITDDQP